MGKTSKAQSLGNFTYFFLAGTIPSSMGSPLNSLRVLLVHQKRRSKDHEKSTGVLIVKLKEEQNMSELSKNGIEHKLYNAEVALPKINIENGGSLVVVTSEELGMLKNVGLSSVVIKLQKNAMYAPQYSSDSAFQVNYIVKGGGRVQVVGLNGQNVLITFCRLPPPGRFWEYADSF